MEISQELESMAKDRPVVNVEPQHENYRCRFCLFTDGYTEEEDTCRHCGHLLNPTDSI